MSEYVLIKDGTVESVIVFEPKLKTPIPGKPEEEPAKPEYDTVDDHFKGYDLIVNTENITGAIPGPGWKCDATGKVFSKPDKLPATPADAAKQKALAAVKAAGISPTSLNGTATGKAVLFLLCHTLNITEAEIAAELAKES